MEGYTHKCTLVFLAFAILWNISIALPVDSTEKTPIPDTLVNTNNPDINELVQIQAETIKKILSASRVAAEQDKNIRKNCDEIESSIKETLSKSNAEEQQKTVENEENQDVQEAESTESQITIRENDRRGDLEPESSVTEENTTEVVSEKSALPNGRTLFTYYKTDRKDDGPVQNITTFKVETTVTEETRTYTEGQNIILIPCMKKIVTDVPQQQMSNEDPNRRFIENTNTQSQNQNVHIQIATDKPVSITTDKPLDKPEPVQALVLEKVYSPSGQFLYYMYRLRNVVPQQQKVITTTAPTTTTSATTTKSTTTTTTSTTTIKPIPEPVYTEQMKFVVRVPLTDPEPISRYPWKFDKFAYYPKDLQPAYINAPVPYSPTYHIIRTLAVPNGDGQYVLQDPHNPSLEKK